MPYSSNSTINGLDAETSIADTDELIFGDVSDTNRAKKITFANLKTEITGDDTAFVRKADYDANSILYATSDNTPIALTVVTNSVVGRVGGNITTLAVDSDLSSVSASDDTVPSAKATKTALDLKANDADVVHDTGNETIAGVKTFSSDPIIPDEAYGSGWDGVLEPPTKNAVYDKIESLPDASDVTFFLGAGSPTANKEYFIYEAFFGNSLWTSSNAALTDKSYYGTRAVSNASNYSFFAVKDGSFTGYSAAGGKKLIVEFFVRLNSVGTNTVKFGLAGNTNAFFGAYNETSFDAAFFTVDGSGGFRTQTSQGSSVTNTTISGVTLTDFNRYRIEITPTVDVKYYVNGVLKATDTTNLPDGNINLFGLGGSSNTTNYVDLISLPTIAVEI